MGQKVAGFRLGTGTPERALAAAGLSKRVGLEALVEAAARHDQGTRGYLSLDELTRGAHDLALARAAKPSGTPPSAGVVRGRAAAATFHSPVAKPLVPDFSVATHVMPTEPKHLGSEWFFGIQYRRISYHFADRFLRGAELRERLPELVERAKKGPFSLPGGVEVELVTAAPKVDGYFSAKPPLVAMRRGEDTVYVEASAGFLLSSVLVRDQRVQGDLTAMDTEEYRSLPSWKDMPPLRELEMRFSQGVPSVEVAATLASMMDAAFHGGAGGPAIAEARAAERAMRAEALGGYFTAVKAVESFRTALAHVKAHGPAVGLGDHDMTIKVAKHLSNQGKVVDKETGPLLVFDNHASGATTGVSIAALAEGRLEIHAAYDGRAEGVLEIDAKGRLVRDSAAHFAGTIAFNREFWVGQLLETAG